MSASQQSRPHTQLGPEQTMMKISASVSRMPDRSPYMRFLTTFIDVVSPEYQHGVRVAEAITSSWATRDLVITYIFIWIVAFVQVYVTEHSLTAITSIISTVIAVLFKLPYAKLINVWGRHQGFALMVLSIMVGFIMMAACNDVKAYCAAQVFYNVGWSGIDFTLTIIIADTTQLKNRALVIAYSSSPWIAVTWAYGPTAASILNTIGFDGGTAQKAGLVHPQQSGRTIGQSIHYYLVQFDVFGLFIIITGFALFLLSFSLYSYQADGWKSPLIVCFIIIGGLLFISFVFWEKYGAESTFIPWALMKNRTVFFTYTFVASFYAIWYIWNSYFYSCLVVVFDQSISHATYITNTYTIGSCVWSVVMGIIIRYNGRLKWQALYFGLPLSLLGTGLMVKFRQPDSNVGYIVMCQVFIALGGGTLVICEQMTVMAVSKHQDIPAVLALKSTIVSIGSAIGSTVAAAMWTGIFPVKLAEYLPAEAQADLASIYGSLTTQSSYPVGSPTRDGINRAYGETQRYMLIAATCVYIIPVASVLMWREVNVKDIKQIKGRVM
ncbi:siderophore iron transporter-like protein mirB [Myriangium duriaei CBS 260.36]|uniref:Siderophore iron transporter-like protein mirB n=1 Tax=Myriangium duriaei CBS 260.36 TaxID=1168546 RepID=A0A9P4ISD3_9PEZI|nr:siderophore iron transporter-like protein mirB [Myriangium duriaei CBS 260.36]